MINWEEYENEEIEKVSDEEVNSLKEIYDFFCSHEDLFYTDDEGYLHYKDADANLVPENVRSFIDGKLKRKKQNELRGRFL